MSPEPRGPVGAATPCGDLSKSTRRAFGRRSSAVIGLAVLAPLLLELVAQLAFAGRFGMPIWRFKIENQYARFTPYGAFCNRPAHLYSPSGPKLRVDDRGCVETGTPPDWTATVVLVLGGSTVAGYGASCETATLPGQLQAALDRLGGRRWSVVNGGCCGFNVWQERQRLDDPTWLPRRPDVVVALDGRNDAFYAIGWADVWRPNWQPYLDGLTASVNDRIAGGLGLREWLLWHSVLCGSLDYAARLHRDPRVPQTTPPADAVLAASVRAWRDNHLLAAYRVHLDGGVYLACLQPTLLAPRTDVERKLVMDYERTTFRSGFVWPALSRWYSLAREAAGENQCFLDLSGILHATDRDVYFDAVHYTDAGNSIIAQALAHAIVARTTHPETGE